jgi:Holliday junction resolvasome RuvABC endonuclease subunit
MTKKIIGLDLSINSTGIYSSNGKYHIIASKMTKEMSKCEGVDIFEYNKVDDINKNLEQIGDYILYVVEKFHPNLVVIEDVAMGATFSRSLIDLTGLNYWVRALLTKNNIKFITVPPTRWKKELIGNGQATKDLIIDAWRRITKNNIKLKKCDDIADAYFLCQYGLNLNT